MLKYTNRKNPWSHFHGKILQKIGVSLFLGNNFFHIRFCQLSYDIMQLFKKQKTFRAVLELWCDWLSDLFTEILTDKPHSLHRTSDLWVWICTLLTCAITFWKALMKRLDSKCWIINLLVHRKWHRHRQRLHSIIVQKG